MSISLLSLGWEFPPNVWGGLGVAYTALNQELSNHINITAFVPQPETISAQSPNDHHSSFASDSDQELVTVTQEVSTSYTVQNYSYEVVRIPIPEVIDPYTGETSLYQKVTTLPKVTEQEIHNTHTIVKEEPISQPDLHSDYSLEENGLWTSMAFNTHFPEGIFEQPLFLQVYKYALKAIEKAEETSFDLIHSHDWMTSLAGFELKRKYKKPLIIHIHSLEYDRNSIPDESWIYDLEKKIYEEADALIAVSTYTKNVLIQKYHLDEDKIFVIPNGVASVTPKKMEKAFPEVLILFLGRLTYQKAPEMFIQIAERIISQNPNTRFVLGGRGEKEAELIQQTASAKIGDRVHFTGHLEREKVHQLLGMTDIFIMPSISEPFGLVALEAAQFKIPCVLSQNSGAAEVLPHAFSANPSKLSEWIDIILKLINDPELRTDTADKQLEDLELLTWDNTAQKVRSLMEEVLKNSVDVL